MYHFERASLYRVYKVDIKASAAVLAAAEPIKPPTKSFALLTELNSNAVDDLTNAISTELARKRRCAEATSYAQKERVTVSDSETDTEEEDKITPGLCHFKIQLFQKNNQNGMWARDICLVPQGGH